MGFEMITGGIQEDDPMFYLAIPRKIAISGKNCFYVFVALLVFGVWLSPAAWAVTRYVPSEYARIQDAIDASDAGDTVEIDPGVYCEAFDFREKAITVRAGQGGECIFENACDAKITIENVQSGTARLEGFRLRGLNVTLFQQGVIDVHQSNAELARITFESNTLSALFQMGILLNVTDSDVVMTNCSFLANDTDPSSVLGGYVVILEDSEVTLLTCVFEDNQASYALDCRHAQVTVDACVFARNQSFGPGGGILMMDSMAMITRSVFSDNTSPKSGGAIAMWGMAGVVIGNANDLGNTFSGNEAPVGGDIYYRGESVPVCSARFNTFDGLRNERNVHPLHLFDLRDCSWEGNGINADIFVSPSGDDANDGLAPETAFRSITHAMDVASPDLSRGITIHVAAGTYSPSTTGERMPIPVFDDIHLAGAGRDVTIVDAEQTASTIICRMTRSATISDIMITGGSAVYGGGIDCGDFASPVIRRCAITGNYGTYGGGLFVDQSYPTIMACDIWSNNGGDAGGGMYGVTSSLVAIDSCFSDNTVIEAGGGVYVNEGSTQFYRCTFSGNSAERGGGIRMYTEGASEVVGCRITGNTATEYGGGLALYEASATVINTLITGNQSAGTGGGIDVQMCEPDIRHVTVADNSGLTGGGISCSNAGNAMIRNSIVYGNIPEGIDMQGSEPLILYSDVQNPIPGEGNMVADPLFVPVSDDAYRLAHAATGQSADSPCVNAGSEPAAQSTFVFFGQQVSMTHYSTRQDSVPDTAVVDMGFHGEAIGFGLAPSVQIVMNDWFSPGDPFRVQCRIYNAGEPMASVPVVCAAYLAGAWYLWPQWTAAFDCRVLDIPTGMVAIDIVPACIWPDTGIARADDFWTYGGMLSADYQHIRGGMDGVKWGYGPADTMRSPAWLRPVSRPLSRTLSPKQPRDAFCRPVSL
ncbi:right-handed parallel beta-helix repeat-containing protein [bacterium]|nr:right-handed parallel beta-helix repeat-containing protein [candidate division CSSED10-310 bacterium]